MSGIVTLAELVIEVMDGNNDFTGTVYGGPKIIRTLAGLKEDAVRFRTPEHPNLMRSMIEVEYTRVRIGTGNPHYRDLIIATIDKLKNHPLIAGKFIDRITAVDDPNDPSIDGITSHKPYLGVKSNFDTPRPQFSEQREEILPIRLYIYSQRFPKQMTEGLLGE